MADPADGLGGFPILQWALAAGAFIGGMIAVALGVRSKSPPSGPASGGRGVEWFFDGPIAKALDRLDGLYREQRQTREDQQRQANEVNEKLDVLAGLARETNTLLGQIKERLSQYQVNGPRRRP